MMDCEWYHLWDSQNTTFLRSNNDGMGLFNTWIIYWNCYIKFLPVFLLLCHVDGDELGTWNTITTLVSRLLECCDFDWMKICVSVLWSHFVNKFIHTSLIQSTHPKMVRFFFLFEWISLNHSAQCSSKILNGKIKMFSNQSSIFVSLKVHGKCYNVQEGQKTISV